MSDLHVQFQILQYAYQRNKHAKGVQADSMTARIDQFFCATGMLRRSSDIVLQIRGLELSLSLNLQISLFPLIISHALVDHETL